MDTHTHTVDMIIIYNVEIWKNFTADNKLGIASRTWAPFYIKFDFSFIICSFDHGAVNLAWKIV